MTLHNCSQCGTLNNKSVNQERCYSCGHEWTTVARVVNGP